MNNSSLTNHSIQIKRIQWNAQRQLQFQRIRDAMMIQTQK